MTHIEVLKQARDCIRDSVEYKQGKATAIEAVEDIDEALAQPQQEPVATVQCIHGVTIGYLDVMQPVGTMLYTSLLQRKPLTDDELADLWYKQSLDWMEFARAIEAAHGIGDKT